MTVVTPEFLVAVVTIIIVLGDCSDTRVLGGCGDDLMLGDCGDTRILGGCGDYNYSGW